MDELSLIAEGLENKVKKLLVRNRQLKEKIFQLEEERFKMQEQVDDRSQQIKQFEEQLAGLEAARVIGRGDSVHARQKINELLREIDKCQSLLNS